MLMRSELADVLDDYQELKAAKVPAEQAAIL